jgi:hypothetical protein
MMDEYEELVDLIDAFAAALDSAKEKRQRPFKGKGGKEHYRRLQAAVSPVLGQQWLHGNQSRKSQQSPSPRELRP